MHKKPFMFPITENIRNPNFEFQTNLNFGEFLKLYLYIFLSVHSVFKMTCKVTDFADVSCSKNYPEYLPCIKFDEMLKHFNK